MNEHDDEGEMMPLGDALDAVRFGLLKPAPVDAGHWNRSQAAAATCAAGLAVSRARTMLDRLLKIADAAIAVNDDRVAEAREFGIGDLDEATDIAKMLAHYRDETKKLKREVDSMVLLPERR